MAENAGSVLHSAKPAWLAGSASPLALVKHRDETALAVTKAPSYLKHELERGRQMNYFEGRCPVCRGNASIGRSDGRDVKQFECPKCGQFEISRTALAILPGRLDNSGSMGRARLSHSLQELQRYQPWPFVEAQHLNKLIDAKLPSADEQLANLVRWMLEMVDDDYLSPIEIPDYERLAAIIGSRDGDRVYDLVGSAAEDGLIKWVGEAHFSLTIKGSRTMKDLLTDDLTLVKSSGDVVKKGIRGRITSGKLITFDSSLPIQPGDRFLRHLPSGLEEEFVVEDPGYQAAIPGMEAHFQAKIRRSDAPAQSLQTIVNNIQGANARVNIHSTDSSTNILSQDNRMQIYNELRDRLHQLSADPSKVDAIREAIEQMEAAHGTPSFKDRYTAFMSVAADHLGVFGPLLAALSALL